MNNSLILILFFSITSLYSIAKEPKLEDYIDGILNSKELAIGLHKNNGEHLHIVTYLSRLKLKDPSKPVPAELEYNLWRHFADCHHLCQVFYHQTYNIQENLPIFDILESAFKGFKKASTTSAGLWISSGYDFLQTVDPFKKVIEKALQKDSQ